MSTRSRIGIRLANDSILSVYHHYDGYPQWLGVILKEKFNTFDKVAELIDGGDVSCIESDTNWKREQLDTPIVLYYNDRGEDTEPALHLNEEDYFADGEEYAYIFEREGVWNCFELPYQGKPKQVEIRESVTA